MKLHLLNANTCQQVKNAGFNFIRLLSSVNYENKRCRLYEAVTSRSTTGNNDYYSLDDDAFKKILAEKHNSELYICY